MKSGKNEGRGFAATLEGNLCCIIRKAIAEL